ncbi:hypothetical protein ACYFX5_06920 [Bremerella sp. T1]|uniref:hypothetical protein n=1 Tax=Bremerella sp. TYQ1 TaxID=3119568 RepID=UPI001CCD3916|nr:hypothetical protein [Bremerella volcania]UBM37988.1 hypothetical protein LA756_08855 [Bremerella volcania]
MITTKVARRVTIVLDASLKELVFEQVQSLGACCFHYMEVNGQGLHAVTGDPYNGTGLLRMEIVTTEAIGAKLLDWIHAAQFAQLNQYALFAFADNVEVDERDQSMTKLG